MIKPDFLLQLLNNNIDEDVLEHGVALHAQYAYDYLNEK